MKKNAKTWVYICIGNTVILLLVFFLFSIGSLTLLKKISYTQTEANLRTFALSLGRLIAETETLFIEKGKQGTDPFDAFVKQIAADDPGFRITIIGGDGKILGDSDTETGSLENHAQRPEVKAALEGVESTNIRTSSTTGQKLIYYAVPIQYKDTLLVLRLSMPAENTVFFSSSIKITMLLSAAGIIAAAILTALFISSHNILKPLKKLEAAITHYQNGDFDWRTEISGPEEFAVLGNHIAEMAASLQQYIHILASQNDQTEAILSGMNEALFVFDRYMHLLNINKAAELLFGITADKSIGLPLIRIIRSTDIADFAARVIRGIETEPEIEVQLQPPVSRFFLIRCCQIDTDIKSSAAGYGNIAPGGAQNDLRFILVCTDITRLKNLERIRKDFVANVSHELKTPITAIQGFIETLQDGALEDKEAALYFLDIMSRQSRRLSSIIENLLVISRLEQNEKQPLIKEAIKIQDLFTTVEQICGHTAQEKNTTLRFETLPDITAEVNPGLIEQALTNLIDNAVKYSPAGSVITVRAELKKEQTSPGRHKDYLFFIIEDNGPGIPEYAKDRIFERFYRIDRGRSRDMGGTGLGLSIVRHIVLAHGGTIRIETPKKGVRFIIKI